MAHRNRKESYGTIINRRLLGYDKVYFISHALDRTRQRGITREDVFRTIEKPDVTGLPTTPGRIRVRWEKSTQDGIDVVYELGSGAIRVLTTFQVTKDAEKGKAQKILRVKKVQPTRKQNPQKRRKRK